MNAKPHDGMVWVIDPQDKGNCSEEVVLPFEVIKEGFQSGLWDALNRSLNLLLDEYEGARVENKQLRQFALEIRALSKGLSARTLSLHSRKSPSLP